MSLTLQGAGKTTCWSNGYALHVDIIGKGGNFSRLNADAGQPGGQLLTGGDKSGRSLGG